jgi:hypothetical protein
MEIKLAQQISLNTMETYIQTNIEHFKPATTLEFNIWGLVDRIGRKNVLP